MKKLFLLSATCAISAMSATAQYASKTASSVLSDQTGTAELHTGGYLNTINDPIRPITDPSVGKTTVGGSRWYSYVDYVGSVAVSLGDSASFPYLWNKGNAKAIYSDGAGGLIADTITFASYGITFDPAFLSNPTSTTAAGLGGFNEPTASYPKNSIVVTRAKAYTVDSVRIEGVYGRNLLKTASTDTLRLTLVYGNGSAAGDMPFLQFSVSAPMTGFPWVPFKEDTVRFAAMKYDKINNTVKGTTKVVKDIYLKSTDTSISNTRYFSVPVGMSVPAGNVVGISATFISGETYTPFKDTVFFGSLRPANPYNFGMIRPLMYSEPPSLPKKSDNGFPAYFKNYYNIGFVKNLPDNASWDTLYVPNVAYTAPFRNELPAIDVKVSCATCSTIQELSILDKTIFNDVNAFPNPANAELNIPFSVKEKATITVSISNMVGQVIATQNVEANAGQAATATFNTSNLASGVYLYTLKADGQQVTNRFTVAH